MGNSNCQTIADTQPSKFYVACRSGDIDTVKQMLPTMKLKEINRIEPNNSTALHAAACSGHYEIVECLLKHGCSTTTINKNGKTAAQECNDEIIRNLIQSSIVIPDHDELKTDPPPQSKWCQIYKNMDNQDASTIATRVMKLRLRTYLTQQFKTDEANRTDQLKKMIVDFCPKDHQNYDQVLECFEKFEASGNPDHLVTLYLMESPIYSLVREQGEVYCMELLIGLTVFQKRFYKGLAYRGITMDIEDLDCYLWCCRYRTSFIELRIMNGASMDRNVAHTFANSAKKNLGKITVLFIYDFPELCETAIDTIKESDGLSCLSDFPYEKEVLIIPGTFFEVTSVEKSPSSDRYIDWTIKLKNIPVSREVLLKTIKELK